MAKYTQGPYRVEYDQDTEEYNIEAPGNRFVAKAYNEADAVFLAASWGMFDVLKQIDEDDRCGGICHTIPHGILLQLRDAINKATANEGRVD